MSFTVEELKERLEYDPATGKWRWLRGRERILFKEVGTVVVINGKKRRYIKFKQRQYYSYRLAWFYMLGGWPTEIDHIDGDSLNDKWGNLREVTHQQNYQNSRLRNNRKTGRFEVARGQDTRIESTNDASIGNREALDL